MTAIAVDNGKLIIEMKGWDKLWALKSRLEIPLEHVKAVHADPEIVKHPKGIRMPGTHVPGVLTAGTCARRATVYFGMFMTRRTSS